MQRLHSSRRRAARVLRLKKMASIFLALVTPEIKAPVGPPPPPEEEAARATRGLITDHWNLRTELRGFGLEMSFLRGKGGGLESRGSV